MLIKQWISLLNEIQLICLIYEVLTVFQTSEGHLMNLSINQNSALSIGMFLKEYARETYVGSRHVMPSGLPSFIYLAPLLRLHYH